MDEAIAKLNELLDEPITYIRRHDKTMLYIGYATWLTIPTYYEEQTVLAMNVIANNSVTRATRKIVERVERLIGEKR